MHETNIKSLDLNLLVALKALLEEKHVTRAALKIGLSQPAMSRALARLRKTLNDPLLVSGAGGLTLTSRANELQQPLQTIFAEINHIIFPPTTDPSHMQGEISIATRDNEMITVLPQVINHISQEAPGLKLRILPLPPSGDDLDLLEQHETDFVLSAIPSKSATLIRQVLYKEEFISLVSAKNPVIEEGLNLKNFLGMKHCIVSTAGFKRGFVDNVLADQGLKREIAVRVPNFLAVSYIVAHSNLIATVPKRIGSMMAHGGKIIILTPPIKIPSFSIYLYWHIRNQNNPTHKWVRKLIKTCCYTT